MGECCKRIPLSASFGHREYIVLFQVMFQLVRILGYTSNNRTKIPAIFTFGDSIIDPGNNNHLKTLAKCNFPPYGKDFIGHQPTGRFSNGKLATDFLVSGFGIKELLPPYLWVHLSPEDLLTGVSFASGACGYDPLTSALSNVISMTGQLRLFGEYKERLKAIAGEERAEYIVSESLYLVSTGTDDIVNTYFATPFRNTHYDIPSYVDFLVSKAKEFLRQLRQMGAKKIWFGGIPPIGCVPSQRTLVGGILRECEPRRNEAAQLFNSRMQNTISELGNEESFRGTILVYIDIYNILLDLIQRPYAYGFEESTRGCCGTGLIEVTFLCNSITATTCPDETKFVFWDSFHPTEKAYKIIADYILSTYTQTLS
ncbi:GDSL esterase/lipase At5g42170-like [Ananas comosus]|uniref:GDSL esterase/lipase n=1 Tax=Ananas comosus TaxID=4615 RepID=A0A199VUQ7_ANACO|nr:GDSL esterase/lipase At5g42170-like [Ananas comosus]OAY80718.1 GDSL esterase/lipase [Ananas comosus]